MIHQPMSGTQGQISDMEIALKEGKKLKEELYNILSQHTGKSFEEIERDSDRDYWMKADEAKEYGMIDEVLGKKK
jgi:ATP-dependent Clp protease protease subunit